MPLKGCDPNMNICLFTASFLPKVAGMEIVIDRLAREFIAMGHNVVVLAKTPRKMKRAPEFPYPVYYYRRSMSEVWFNGAPKRMLAHLHRQYRFDVIHAHQIYPTGYLGWKMTGKLGIPTVMTSHVGDVREGSRLRRKPVTNRRMIEAMTRGAAVTGVGAGVCATIDEMVGFRRAIYIGNGTDIPVEPTEPSSLGEKLPFPVKEREFDLTLCRLHPNKGLLFLIDALGILKKRGVEFPPLLMAGSGREEEAIRTKIAECGLSGRVFLIGQVNGAERDFLMSRTRLFLQPSVVEGMPMTVLEAMAGGCAIVGSDIPGIRELLADGENGRLVPPGNAAALADVIAEFGSDHAALERCRAAALATARANTWRTVAERYLALFRQVIAAEGKPVLPVSGDKAS